MKKISSFGWSAGAFVALLVTGTSAFAATPVSFREYIYSNASGAGPIFNTGVYPNKTTRIVMTFKKDKTSGNQIFFGVRGGGFEFVNFTDATDGTMMSFRFGNSTQHTINPTGYVIGEKATLDFGPAGAFLDGRQIVSASSLAGSANNNTSSRSLALFTVQDGQYDTWSRAWQGYCYDFKVYQGDSCVLRYYPCLDSDGTACFYDAVSKSLVYRATDYTTPAYDKGTLTLSANEREDIRLNDGTVEFKVAATVNDSNLGSVSVSSDWCAEGVSSSLTATPVEGFEFSHWEGDVDAIVSGSTTDVTVSVSPKLNAVSLKAVFAGNMVVEDRILKIKVPANVTCTDDYTPYLADVTNVVKLGAGTLVSKSSSTYRGDWTIAEGVFEYTTANAFGQVVADDYTPVVRVLDGAQIYHNAHNLALYRTIRLAGNGPGSTGAYRFLSQSGSDYGVQYVKIFLDADATVNAGNRHALNTGTVVDCLGHKLSITGYQNNIPLTCSFTNSSETAATVSTASGSYSKYYWNAKTTGGPQNTVSGDTGRFYAYRAVSAYDPDTWTFVFNGTTAFRSNVRGLNTFTRGWEGPVRVDKDAGFNNADGSAAGDAGYASTLWGPLSGSADRTITVTRSIVNVCNANNDYAGAWVLAGCGTTDYRNTLVFANGANWCGKSLAMTDSDLILDATVDRALPAITVNTKDTFTGFTGSAKIAGGTAGTTIASITVTGPNVLTLDTPAIIGELNVTSGTVALSSLPEVTKLVTATGATLDLGGQVLTVDSFEGDPGAVVNGKVHVCKSFTVPPGSVIDTNVFDWSATGRVCVKPAGPLDAGTYPGAYVTGDIDVTTVWGQMAPGDYATFTKRVIAEGEHAGQTLVEMTVTKTPPTATWSATRTGGAWSNAENWNGATPPTAADVTFPKAEAAEVPVNVDRDATLYGFTMATGSGSATDKSGDWFNPFGYSFAGEKSFFLGSDVLSFVFGAGQNTVNVPLCGSGELSLSAPLYPATNLAGVAYSKLTLGPKALGGFTGALKVNVDGSTYHAPVALDTTGFAGSLTMRGSVTLNSLAFVAAGGSLTLSGWGEFAYEGDDVEIPALAFQPSSGTAIIVSNAHDIAVKNLTVSRTDASLLKRGAGSFKILGNGSYTFKVGASPSAALGFPNEQDVHFGVAASYRRNAIAIADGTLEIGVKDDPDNAPTVTTSDSSDPYGGSGLSGYSATGISLGNAWSQSRNPTLKVNNGNVKVSTLSPAMYTGYDSRGWTDPFDSVHTVEVNGGKLEANCVFSRIGNIGWPRGSHVYTVNGGEFKVNGFFNLTQLIPESGKSSTYKTGNPRTFSINGGAFSAPVFRMAYSRGWSWEGSSVSSGYGEGLQPDSYLNVNGGEFTASEYLMANDRSDSDSWINLNGGTLKVNLLTNTNARCVFTFNGGTYAPLGKADYATTVPGGKLSGERAASDDILKFKRLKTAQVAAGGAVFDTSFMTDTTQTFVIEQALVHDATLDGADGGLVKRGAGKLELAGANTFTGPVAVEGGTLVLADKTALLRRANAVSLATGAKLGLKSGKVKVASLTVNGEALPAGIYGSSASGAPNVDDTLFEGAGQLYVGDVGLFMVVR